MAERINLVVGTPCFGGNVTHRYALSLLNLQAACLGRGITTSFRLLRGDAMVTRSRNLIVGDFLSDPTATHLMFIDADIGFEPAQAFALLDSGYEVSAAAYPVKYLDWQRLRDKADPAAGYSYVVDFEDSTKITPVGRFARARYVGAGFLLMRRSVFERMGRAYPELAFRHTHTIINTAAPGTLFSFFDGMIDPETGFYLSEDYTFCKRWTGIGGEIWVDLQSRLTHTGPVDFDGDLRQILRPSAT